MINPEFAALAPGSLTYVSDLSETGVFIHSKVRLPVGAAIDLRFTVLLDEPIVIHGPGRVIHHQDEPRGMGVAFGSLSAEMQLRVIDAINWYRARDLSGEQPFRTRELSPDELRQIEEEDEEGEDPAEESVTSLSTSDVVAESGSYQDLSRGGLVPVDDDDEVAAPVSRKPPPAPVRAPPPPDDEYEDF